MRRKSIVGPKARHPWLQFYPGFVPPTLEYPSIPVYRLLQRTACRFPQRPAVIFYCGHGQPPVTKTYWSLDEESDRFAAALGTLGISKGDRVAYFLQNSPALVVAFYGILKAGAVPVPCNPMYRQEELTHQVLDSGARAILCDVDVLPIVRGGASSCCLELPTVVVGEQSPPPGIFSFVDLVREHEPLRNLPGLDPANDLALLPYTGGTTGIPKGVMLTHFNLVANSIQFAQWYQYQEGAEAFISVLPLFHIGGISGAMTVPISVGATMVLFRRFNARDVLQAIQDHRATRFLGVPTMYIAILALEGATSFDLSSLRHSRTGAAPLPVAVKQAFDGLVGHEVLVEGYGLTETSPLTHANPVHRARAGSIGVPLPDTDACIVDAEEGRQVLPVGEVGELVLRGPQVMKGYWQNPRETANAIRHGWFYTGDLARMDEEGYFYIVDRKKDMINAAGFKVWPREVEEVLYRHPAVRMAAVIGVPDAYRGETVKAVVVPKEDTGSASPEELRQSIVAFCQQELAAYKVPRIIEFRDGLPISGAGKVLRRGLREEARGVPDT